MTCGPEAPRPSTARPAETLSSPAAVCRSAPGRAREDVEDARADLEPSRSWRPGSPSAWASRSRRPRPPRPCRGRPSRARRPGRPWRAGCRRTGGGRRAAPANCDSETVTVKGRPDRRVGCGRSSTPSTAVVVGQHVAARRAELGPEVGGVLGGDVVGVAVAQRAADDDRALALVAEPRASGRRPRCRSRWPTSTATSPRTGGALDRLEHAVAEARVAGRQAGGGVVGRLGHVADQRDLVGVLARARGTGRRSPARRIGMMPVDRGDPLVAVEDAVDRRRRGDHDEVGVRGRRPGR